MSNADFLGERTRYWALALTAMPSVTGTADEADFAGRLMQLLEASPAFSGDDSAVWSVAAPGGRHQRACVLGLVRGQGRRTIILTGHFDTVETSCYGWLEPLALLPERLGPALVERIAREPFDPHSAKARLDLAGGEFMAGRGLLDMKAGLAAGLAVAEAFSAEPGRRGNILFVAVPDEEGNSAGARRMAETLDGVAREHGLDLEAVINLDANADDGDSGKGRTVALGSIGKLLPSALVVGKPMHVSDTFRGFGAAALAGALAAEVEWLPELTERSGEELGAGPTLLGMKDAKTAYDVTMPASVWMYWNVALHRNGPAQVLSAMRAAARRAAERLTESLRSRAGALGADAGFADVAIITYAELLAGLASGESADAVAALAAGLGGGDVELPEQCRRLTELAWSLSGRTGPAIVLGFASTPYLAATLGDDAAALRLARAVREAIETVGTRFGTSFRTVRYFPGISDVSFFGQADVGSIPAIAANTPAWQSVLGGSSRFAVAGIPCINAGPWGRDYHTRLERLHVDYGFRVFPALLQEICALVLQ